MIHTVTVYATRCILPCANHKLHHRRGRGGGGRRKGKEVGKNCGLSRRDAKARTEVFYSEIDGLWCEAFAPQLPNARLPLSRCVPLHHQRGRGGGRRRKRKEEEKGCGLSGRYSEARAEVFYVMILRSVVRSLRTTAPKCSPPSFTLCAFVPLFRRAWKSHS